MASYNGYVYQNSKEFPFRIYEATKNFSAQGSFSDANLTLRDVRDNSGFSFAVRLSRLVNFHPDILKNPETRPQLLKEPVERLITLLKRCKRIDLNQQFKMLKTAQNKVNVNEKDVVVTIAKHILLPLFGNVTYEKGYEKYLLKTSQDVDGEYLGIGSEYTWHGSTELRVEGCNIISTEEDLSEGEQPDYVSSDEESLDDTSHPGASYQPPLSAYPEACPSPGSDSSSDSSSDSTFEGKVKVDFRRLISQLVETCVVCSFTENNINPRLNTMVPTVLFNMQSFRVCLYDCKNDILLISEPRPLTSGNKVSRTACFIIWLVVHHR